MTLRQIKDAEQHRIPSHRAYFVQGALDPYLREEKRVKERDDYRMQIAASIVQALRDLRHLSDEINADFVVDHQFRMAPSLLVN